MSAPPKTVETLRRDKTPFIKNHPPAAMQSMRSVSPTFFFNPHERFSFMEGIIC